MWFEKLTGFPEKSAKQVREKLRVDGDFLKSTENGKAYKFGRLETPSLAELRHQVNSCDVPQGKLSVREIVADVQTLHAAPENASALFQVASQFNLLEMISPEVTPEDGVDKYKYDPTQGPACAIAAGAGTIYRNYFAEVNGQLGQSAHKQIDCLEDLGVALGNSEGQLWVMKNGYALASKAGLSTIENTLNSASEKDRDEMRKLLRVGIQWDTEVTITNTQQTVSQAYCSALPVAYSGHPSENWAKFAELILEATYEATICAGVLNYLKTGNNTVYLTLIGGGAFGNKAEWIIDALNRSLHLYKTVGLDVAIVSYGSSNNHVQDLIANFQVKRPEPK